ncbi:MAG: TolC family protein [Campylobacterota bacterium]|nr:TolC family protein [Campylobacterota bacterium]
MKSNKILFIFLNVSLLFGYLNAELLTISKAYELALQNSSMMKSSNYQLQANKKSVEQVKAELYPQINGSITHKKTDFEINKEAFALDKKYSETSTDFMVSLSQSIYNPQTYARLNVEKTRVKLYELSSQIEKQELAKAVLKAYLDVLKSKNKISLLDSYMRYGQYKLESIEKKFNINLANKMDFLQAKVEFNSSKLELSKEKSLYKVYKLKLSNLIGLKDIELPSLDASKLSNTVVQNIYSKVNDRSDFKTNLEVQQALFAVEISKYDIKNSKSGHYPKLNFDAIYTKYDSDDETTDYENTKKMMLSLKIPIYQGGYVNSKVEASKLNLKAASEDLIQIQDEIQSRYDELMALFGTSVESVNLYKETLESTKLYLDSVELGYQNGLKSVVDLYDAKNKVFEVEYKYIENMYGMMDSYIGLLMVTNNFEELKLLDQILN